MIRFSSKLITYYFLILFIAMVFMVIGTSLWWLVAPILFLTVLVGVEFRALWKIQLMGEEATLKFILQMPSTLALGIETTGSMQWQWYTDSNCDLISWKIATEELVELLPEARQELPATQFRIFPKRLGTWKPLAVDATFRSPLGFWTRSLKGPISQRPIRIHPAQHPLSTEDFLDLFSQAPRLVEGRRRRSASREAELFHSIRRFQTGDPVRSIDARRSAQIGQPFVRTFEAHRDHHLIICLDLGRSMLGTIEGSRKLDFYISAMDHLIRTAISQGDRVSVMGFNQHPIFQYRASKNLGAFSHLIETADQLKASNLESSYDRLGEWLQSFSQTRAIVLVMTDVESPAVQENLHSALKGVTYKHLTAILGLSDPLNEPAMSLSELQHHKQAAELVRSHKYANLLYALHIRTQLLQSQRQWTQLGANCVVVDRDRWMSATAALYAQLRASQFA